MGRESAVNYCAECGNALEPFGTEGALRQHCNGAGYWHSARPLGRDSQWEDMSHKGYWLYRNAYNEAWLTKKIQVPRFV